MGVSTYAIVIAQVKHRDVNHPNGLISNVTDSREMTGGVWSVGELFL